MVKFPPKISFINSKCCSAKFGLKYSRIIGAVIFLSLCLVSARGQAGEGHTLRVLFVGNSLTYVNDLPRIVAILAKSRNYNLEYDTFAPGGYRLSQHASDPRLLAKIKQGTWDLVVLQEQSQLPSFPPEQLQKLVYPFAQELSRLIRGANPRAKIAFYMTMAAKNGDGEHAAVYPDVGTYSGMQERINAAYRTMSQQNQGVLVPVGLVWQKARSKSPSLGLYADDKHPNSVGTYLAACVFYEVFFRDSAIGLPYPKEVDAATAVFLQRITDDTLSH